ncbi:hypothetical protein P171DRAFT_434859 [Karstenula rhodostoma CBS 690.94]|uniref:Uncharacterized protein n=1 Tax=Karstenula rhodostoma CBS 690.94 TaxID=1392251 RepID=A0A9P4PDI0_9PLEO|nr:hypothetical protein P171DRAFT_434859 [Karstenula rhodostoma CBS 690.94]
MRSPFLLDVPEVKSTWDLNIPVSPSQVLNSLLLSFSIAAELGKHMCLADHLPTVFCLPNDEEIGVMEFRSEELVHIFGLGKGGGVASARFAIRFDDREVRGKLPEVRCQPSQSLSSSS